MGKIDILRKKYPRFLYKGYSWRFSKGNLNISFDFEIEPNIRFKPKVVIKNVKKNQIKRVGPPRVLNNLIFNLGLIELLSYWKATCSPGIKILAGHLNKEQIQWWKDLIGRGMGQFFFENKIDFLKTNFLNIYGSKIRDNYAMAELSRNDFLVPIGGGKDSVITLELLKKTRKKIQCFSLNPNEAIKRIMAVGGCKKPIIVERKIDKKLLELNQKGFLNGHTPFSAYLAFLSVLVAVIFNLKYIVFSNERSSNEGNLNYLGRVINHQYSKSFDFEKRFRKYLKKYLVPHQKRGRGIEYFSFLRPLYEIQIAKLFSKYPQYFSAFLSCNEAYKTYSGKKKPLKKWCGKCPKCLFVFASLYPFLETKKLIKIFGKNLFEDKKLLPLMLQLIGERKFKPFECVGTKKESQIAFYLSLKKAKKKAEKTPFLLNYFEKKIMNSLPRRISSISERFLRGWNKNHFLPKNFEEILKKTIKS